MHEPNHLIPRPDRSGRTRSRHRTAPSRGLRHRFHELRTTLHFRCRPEMSAWRPRQSFRGGGARYFAKRPLYRWCRVKSPQIREKFQLSSNIFHFLVGVCYPDLFVHLWYELTILVRPLPGTIRHHHHSIPDTSGIPEIPSPWSADRI
jgi:hypothetical protein